MKIGAFHSNILAYKPNVHQFNCLESLNYLASERMQPQQEKS